MTSAKFGNDALTEALWMITLDGGQDEEAGSSDDIGWHGLIHIEQDDKPDANAIDIGYPDVTIPRGTYIVYEISTGAVFHDAYEYKSAEASEAWQSVLDAEAKLYEGLCDVCELELDDNNNSQCTYRPEHTQDSMPLTEEAMHSLLPE